ncbi:MAG TPA: hypothetical protein VF587_04615, partial [Solirubrobacteraceae bacterium]
MRRLLVVAALAALAAPAAARAEDLCVAPKAGCTAPNTFFDLQDALDDAASDPDADRVLLAAGLHASATGFVYDDSADVEVAGDPAGGTVLGGGADTILDIPSAGPDSRIHHLEVDQSGHYGIRSDADLDHVSVVREEDDPGLDRGIVLVGGADLHDADVFMAHLNGSGQGIEIEAAGSRVTDVTVDADQGIRNDGFATTIERVHLTVTERGIAMYGSGSVRDCAIFMRDMEGAIPEGFVAYDSGTVALDGCSIFAADGYGAGVTVFDGGGQSSLDATGLVVRGFFAPISHGDGAEADIRYSDFDTEAMWTGTGGSLVVGPGVDYHEDPGWVDEEHGDLRLRGDSPLIDRGDPAPGPPAWELDVDRLDRSID